MAKQTFTTGQVLTAAQMTSLQQTAMGGGSTTAKTTSYVLTAADAGTVVAMNAAGATTITVNTGLFSAGDTVFIQNWGAGTCTVTAGTATVTTHGSLALGQWEGGTLYFTSASAAIFFDISQTSGMTNPMTTTGDTIYSSSGSTPARLGIGSTGQVLTVAGGIPSWATPASGGGMTLLSTTTLSGARPAITSISGSYKDLIFVISNFYVSAGVGAENMRLEINGSTANTNIVGIGNTAVYSRNRIEINAPVPNSATNNSVVLILKNYASTTLAKSIQVFGGSKVDTASQNIGAGLFSSTSAITSLTITDTNDNAYGGGTVLTYGAN